jgi:putative RNA 2'-phosphotransferase
MNNLKTLSKYLALVLRHEPEAAGLRLDEQGFTDVTALWAAVQQRFGAQRYTLADLETVVAGDADGKKRYEIQQGRIRALYGHNRAVPVVYAAPVLPPARLYHGTSRAALPAIQQHGLLALERQFVHLTTRVDRAQRVARRHADSTVLLVIRADEAHAAGCVFYHAETEHYLVAALPPEFIDFPAL